MTAHASARPRIVSRGPWAFRLRGDELADISYGGNPVLRGVRAVVRNHNWLTLGPHVRSSEVRETDDFLVLGLDVDWSGYGAGYGGRLEARIDDDGVTVTFDGTAPRDFLSNRIGLVVLHRPDDAGRAAAVVHPDGSLTESAFPEEISPHQPFADIASLGWECDGVRFSLGFAGDVFETEDQRNWTDASFKTYSTPLSRPFPVLHAAGSRVSQSVRLSAVHPVRIGAGTGVRVPEIVSSLGSARLPGRVGGTVLLEVSAAPRPGDGTVSVEHALALLEDDGGHGADAGAEARADVVADVRIVAGSAAEAVGILERLPLAAVRRLGVFDAATHVTTAELLGKLAARARELGFGGEWLSGTRGHFTELNRNAEEIPRADGTAYSITSQMHAVEPEAVMESLGMQAATARQAIAIGGGAPLHVGPVTIAPRFNAVATEAPRPDELPRRSPLEAGEFGAAWLLGSVAALTLPGVASLAYAVPQDADAPSAALFGRLAGLAGGEVLEAAASDGAVHDSGPVAYAVRDGAGATCFLANVRPWALAVEVRVPAGLVREVSLPAWSAAAVVLP